MHALQQTLAKFPRARLTHAPTPLEPLARLSAAFPTAHLSVKRDDCTGLAMGGNKARQLEFYLGAALAANCDVVLGTGAVQSNYMRMLAAAAARLGLACHVQLEARVANRAADDEYQHSGNMLLNAMFGATIHHHPATDEAAADDSLATLAAQLRANGHTPYIVPLGASHPPTGALGYVVAAIELAQQIRQQPTPADLIVVPSGSGMTHAGLLTGLKLLAADIPVLGVCVRRTAKQQHPRVLDLCQRLAALLGTPNAITATDIWVDDSALAPGYGSASNQVLADMHQLATQQGILTDPVYSAKTFSCLLTHLRQATLPHHQNIIIIHTGGTPALFAYRTQLAPATPHRPQKCRSHGNKSQQKHR